MKEKGKMYKAYDAVMAEMDEAVKVALSKAVKLVSLKNAGVMDPELMTMITSGMNTGIELKNYFMDLSESIDDIANRLERIERKLDLVNNKEDDVKNQLVDLNHKQRDLKNQMKDSNRYVSGLRKKIDDDDLL